MTYSYTHNKKKKWEYIGTAPSAQFERFEEFVYPLMPLRIVIDKIHEIHDSVLHFSMLQVTDLHFI